MEKCEKFFHIFPFFFWGEGGFFLDPPLNESHGSKWSLHPILNPSMVPSPQHKHLRLRIFSNHKMVKFCKKTLIYEHDLIRRPSLLAASPEKLCGSRSAVSYPKVDATCGQNPSANCSRWTGLRVQHLCCGQRSHVRVISVWSCDSSAGAHRDVADPSAERMADAARLAAPSAVAPSSATLPAPAPSDTCSARSTRSPCTGRTPRPGRRSSTGSSRSGCGTSGPRPPSAPGYAADSWNCGARYTASANLPKKLKSSLKFMLKLEFKNLKILI